MTPGQSVPYICSEYNSKKYLRYQLETVWVEWSHGGGVQLHMKNDYTTFHNFLVFALCLAHNSKTLSDILETL